MTVSESYKIIERLGKQKRRKFGELFLVEDKLTGEKAIIKLVRKTSGNNAIALRLAHESSFSFEFEGLPAILEFEETDKQVLLVRKFVDGIPLDVYWKKIRKKQRLDFILSFIEQFSLILNELDEQRIVHCDIKPSNILIGDKGRSVHLIDFGLAVNTKAPEKRNILFPLGYAAPELLLNHLDLVTRSTDIYALGVVLWRLFVGELPLRHPNPSIFTNLQLTCPIPYDPAIPKPLFPIIQKMTVKHQFNLPPNKIAVTEVKELLQSAIDRRYTTTIDVLKDLKKMKPERRILPKNIFSKS